MKTKFIKGLELSELFYKEAVKPILDNNFPELTYSAALLGNGSDVLGFDTPQSMDHDWGPRLMLFLTQADHDVYWEEIDQLLAIIQEEAETAEAKDMVAYFTINERVHEFIAQISKNK